MIDPVGGNGHFRKIGQDIRQQDLLRQQREKRQEQRGPGHAEHVAEIRAGGHKHIFQRIGEGHAALANALHQHAQIMLQQNEIGRFLGDIDGAIDRNADIRGVERRGIVDTVAQISDDIPGRAQRTDDAFFLIGFDFREDIDAVCARA